MQQFQQVWFSLIWADSSVLWSSKMAIFPQKIKVFLSNCETVYCALVKNIELLKQYWLSFFHTFQNLLSNFLARLSVFSNYLRVAFKRSYTSCYALVIPYSLETIVFTYYKRKSNNICIGIKFLPLRQK